MKLACLRCKHKKIKCDKGEPTCHQCVTASTECVYVERRKRPRLSEQKNDVRNLSRRLEFLEKHLSNGSDNPTCSPSLSQEDTSDMTLDDESSNSVETPVMSDTAQDSWIYRLASDVRRTFEKVNTEGDPSPEGRPQSSTVGNAMSALDQALDDLGKLKVRSDESIRKAPELKLSPEEGRECIRVFREIVSSMVVPDVFVSFLNIDLLSVLPDIMNSPFVNIEPVVGVMYYNALYYGLHKIHGPGSPLPLAAYYKLLEAVPAWLRTATGTDLDSATAALTTWTACSNFDYQLSWKFHCKSCHFLKMKGVDHLDVLPSRTTEEENNRQGLRYLYWHVLQTDLLFRLFYGKPPAIRWTLRKVHPPSLFTPSNMQPSVPQSMLYTIWIRYTVLTVDMFNALDSCEAETRSPEIMRQVDDYCGQLEELLDEWDLIPRMKSPKQSPVLAYLYADHIMNILTSIIGIRRLARRPNEEHPVDPITLKTARLVIDIVLHFDKLRVRVTPDENAFAFFHFISFYPFCAVFSLYEHILACTDPDACEEDIRALEETGSLMKHACEVLKDFVPLSNTINALNKVSRTIQDNRRNKLGSAIARQPIPPDHQTSMSDAQMPTLDSAAHQQHPGLNLPQSTADAFQMLASPSLDPSFQGFPLLQDFPMNPGGEVQPLDFIKALESNFIGRNFHETWWDMNGDMGMPDLPDAPYSNSNLQ